MKTFFEAQIWSMKDKLYRMAFLWVKDRDVANDAVQEVLEKAWANKEALQKMDNPAGWLVRVLKNQCLQHFRQDKKWEPIGEREFAESETVDTDFPEAYKRVFRFLETLPDKQKEVFMLREVEGLTYEEIADYLEISQDQVKVNLFRARKTLREHLLNKANHGRKN
ncbi:RNA polymerase sigma factor [Litoribacter ruber]|uniref:RNA polymerase sigma factor n=1 Tax=Litoribacter ruber TaxID=702568 RepID=UPI001BDB338E|nr:RNA polymerase sigma factor [Litoribacter ruber]MBT0809870.1 RNA polymerase sigma factor [Litoribacter ruber]